MSEYKSRFIYINSFITWAISCKMTSLMTLVAFPRILSGFPVTILSSVITLPRKMALLSTVVAFLSSLPFLSLWSLLSLLSLLTYVVKYFTFSAITGYVAIASTIEALHIWTLIVVVMLSGRSIVFLFSFRTVSGDVSWFCTVVTSIGGWMRWEVHWGQLRAMCPSPPHLKQLTCFSVILVLLKINELSEKGNID